MKDIFEKVALFIIERKKFRLSETELEGIDKSYFNNFIISSGIKQYNLEFNKPIFDEIHNGLFKRLEINAPNTFSALNDYVKEYLGYFDIEVNSTYPPEELQVRGLLNLILNCKSDAITLIEIYDRLNPLLKFGVLKTCFEGYFNTVDVLEFIEKFQSEYKGNFLHRHLFENVEVEKYILNGKLLEVIEFIVRVNQPKNDIILNILLWEIIKFQPIKGLEIINNLEKEVRYNPLIINSLRSLNSTVDDFSNALDIILKKENIIFAEKIITLATFSQKVSDSDFQVKIKNEISAIIKICEENDLYAFLNHIDFFQFSELEKLELIKQVVQNINFSEKLFKKNQSNYHYLDFAIQKTLKSPYNLLEFFGYFTLYSKYEFIPEDFEFSIKEILLPNLNDCIQNIGLLLIDNIGNNRKLAFELIEYFIVQEVEFNLEDFINGLTEDEDVKLILSLNVPFSNDPIELFKIVVPIIKKNKVKSFQQIIGFAIDKFTNYQEIILSFEMFSNNKDDLALVKNLLENNQNFRESILQNNQQNKYFNSELIFYQYFKLYEKYWQNNMNKIFNNMQNEGLVKFFAKKKLLKGGGYKFSNKTNINKLSQIQSKVTIPHEAFLNYDQRIFDTIIFFSENWNDNNVWEKWMKKF